MVYWGFCASVFLVLLDNLKLFLLRGSHSLLLSLGLREARWHATSRELSVHLGLKFDVLFHGLLVVSLGLADKLGDVCSDLALMHHEILQL